MNRTTNRTNRTANVLTTINLSDPSSLSAELVRDAFDVIDQHRKGMSGDDMLALIFSMLSEVCTVEDFDKGAQINLATFGLIMKGLATRFERTEYGSLAFGSDVIN